MRWPAVAGALLLALGVLASGASAQSADSTMADSLRASWRLPVPPPPRVVRYWTVPAMGGASPTGWGSRWGDVYFGVSWVHRARWTRESDGAVFAGFGLGDPWSNLGLQVLATSYSTLRSGVGSRAGLDLKLSRILPGGVGIAAGWENVILIGETDSYRSWYLALSRWFQLNGNDAAPFSALVLSGGVGGERFTSYSQWLQGRKWGFFGSAAVRVVEPVSLVADWTGETLLAVVSVAPLRSRELVFSLGFQDLAGDVESPVRFGVSAGYGFSFR